LHSEPTIPTMKEMLESLTETIKERFRSPLFGTFILAWIIFNWRLLLFLSLSDDPIAIRIHTAETCYINALNGFLYPIIITLFYLIVPGFIMQKVEDINILSIKSRKDIRAKILKHDHFIRMEQAYMDIEYEERKANNRDLKSLNDKIEILTDQINARDKIISDQKEEINNLNKLQSQKKEKDKENFFYLEIRLQEVLKELRKRNVLVPASTLLRKINLDTLEAKDKLTDKKLLEELTTFGLLNYDSKEYKITDFGKNFITKFVTNYF